MNRKVDYNDWEWEKRPKRVEKGINKENKHRKKVYQFEEDVDQDYDLDYDTEDRDYYSK